MQKYHLISFSVLQIKNALFPVGLEVLSGGVVLLAGLHLAGVRLYVTDTIMDYFKS